MDIQEQVRLIQVNKNRDAAINARIRANNNGQPVLERNKPGDASLYDNRTGAYCPSFDEDDNTPEGLIRKETADKFIREYILDGSPQLRKPHLDRILDEILSDSEIHMPANSAQEAVESAKNALDKEYTGKVLYIENLITDNPGYFKAMEPQKMERIRALSSYELSFESVNNAMQKTQGINSNNLAEPLGEENIQGARNELPAKVAHLEAAAVMYKSRIDMLEGKEVKNPAINFNFTPHEEARAVFGLKNSPRPMTFETPGANHASLELNNMLSGVFDNEQRKVLRAHGFDKYDMIYINGVSVTEMFKDKYPKNMDARAFHLNAEIVSAMINDKARIDLTPIMMNKNGNYQPVPTTIKASVKEIQPNVGFFSTSEDKKLQNAFAKNATDKNINKAFADSLTNVRVKVLAAAETVGSRLMDETQPEVVAAMAAKAVARAQEINEFNAAKQYAWPVQAAYAKPDGDLEASMALDLDAFEEELKLDNELTKAKDNPPQHLINSQEFVTRLANDQHELGLAIYGDDFKVANEAYSLGVSKFNNGSIRTGRSGVMIGIALLYTQGHSFEDILDPTKLQAEKQTAGQQIKSWVNGANSKDKTVSEQAISEATNMYVGFYEKYKDAQPPRIDYTNERTLVDNYRTIFGMGAVAFDIGQEIQVNSDTALNQMGFVKPKEGETLSDDVKNNNKQLQERQREREVVLKFSSRPFVVMQDSLSAYKALHIDEPPQIKFFTNPLMGIHLRAQATEQLNNAARMSDISRDFDTNATNIGGFARMKASEMLENDKNVYMRGMSAMINGRDIISNVTMTETEIKMDMDLGKQKPAAAVGGQGGAAVKNAVK